MELETKDLREMTIQMAGDGDFNSNFTFYYDETNNIRKFYLKENGFNAPYDANFVLGGIAYKGEKPNIEDLFSGLKLQASVKEVKLKHIAKGDFLSCLNFDKLTFFLNYLNTNNFYVHYSTVNILYFSIVDIIDSAIANSPQAMSLGQQYAMLLKNDLLKLIKLKISEVTALFYRYKYPDVKKENLSDFINDLLSLFDEYNNINELNIGLTNIRRLLKNPLNKDSMPFITDEEEHILLESFFHFYIRPIYLFTNSTHIFDNEESIKEILDGYDLKDNGKPINTYSFEDSTGNRYIQASDIFIGLEGKFSSFINTISIENLESTIFNLNATQKKNLNLYFDLVDKSDSLNKVLIHNVSSLDDLKKRRKIDEIRKNTAPNIGSCCTTRE